MKLDAIDRRILSELQRDGRMTNQALAERVGLSPTPCLRRVRRLEEYGVIGGYVAVVDQRAVDLPVSVFISIKLERQREEGLDQNVVLTNYDAALIDEVTADPERYRRPAMRPEVTPSNIVVDRLIELS